MKAKKLRSQAAAAAASQPSNNLNATKNKKRPHNTAAAGKENMKWQQQTGGAQASGKVTRVTRSSKDISMYESGALKRIHSKLNNNIKSGLQERDANRPTSVGQSDRTAKLGANVRQLTVPTRLKQLEKTEDFEFEDFSSTQFSTESCSIEPTEKSVEIEVQSRFLDLKSIVVENEQKITAEDSKLKQSTDLNPITQTVINEKVNNSSIHHSADDLETTKFIEVGSSKDNRNSTDLIEKYSEDKLDNQIFKKADQSTTEKTHKSIIKTAAIRDSPNKSLLHIETPGEDVNANNVIKQESALMKADVNITNNEPRKSIIKPLKQNSSTLDGVSTPLQCRKGNDILLHGCIEPQYVSSPIALKSKSMILPVETDIDDDKNFQKKIITKRLSSIRNQSKDFDGFKSPEKSATVTNSCGSAAKVPALTKTLTPVRGNNCLTVGKGVPTPSARHASIKSIVPDAVQPKYSKKQHQFFEQNHLSALESDTNMTSMDNGMYSFSKMLNGKNFTGLETNNNDVSRVSNGANVTLSTYISQSDSIMTRKQRKEQKIALVNDQYLSYLQSALSSKKKSKYVSFFSDSHSRTHSFLGSAEPTKMNSAEDAHRKLGAPEQNSMQESARLQQQNVCIGTGESFLKFCDNVDQIKFANKLSKIYGMSQYMNCTEATVSVDDKCGGVSANIDQVSQTKSRVSSANLELDANDARNSRVIDDIQAPSLHLQSQVEDVEKNQYNLREEEQKMDITCGWALPENQENLLHDITSGWLKYDTQRETYPRVLLLDKPKESAVNTEKVKQVSEACQYSIGDQSSIRQNKKTAAVKTSELGTQVSKREEFAEKFLKKSNYSHSTKHVPYVDLSVASLMCMSPTRSIGTALSQSNHLSSISSALNQETTVMITPPPAAQKPPKKNKKQTKSTKATDPRPVVSTRRQTRRDTDVNKPHQHTHGFECNGDVVCNEQRFNLNTELTKRYVAKHFSSSSCKVEQMYLKGNVMVFPGMTLKHNEAIESSLLTINFYVVRGQFEITDQCGNKIRFRPREYFEVRGGTRYQIRNLSQKRTSQLYFELIPNQERPYVDL
ncbi:MAG: hypothetical protein MHMPM18_000414 [Marteilia pararefringens]